MGRATSREQREVQCSRQFSFDLLQGPTRGWVEHSRNRSEDGETKNLHGTRLSRPMWWSQRQECFLLHRQRERDEVSRQVQTEMRKTCKKEAPSFARSEEGQSQKRERARGRASREADRTSEALPSASPRQQEADPDRAREGPCRTPDATWRGLRG